MSAGRCGLLEGARDSVNLSGSQPIIWRFLPRKFKLFAGRYRVNQNFSGFKYGTGCLSAEIREALVTRQRISSNSSRHHHSLMPASRISSESSGTERHNPTARPKRADTACQRCKRLKVKCSGKSPCTACEHSQQSHDCVFRERDKYVKILERSAPT